VVIIHVVYNKHINIMDTKIYISITFYLIRFLILPLDCALGELFAAHLCGQFTKKKQMYFNNVQIVYKHMSVVGKFARINQERVSNHKLTDGSSSIFWIQEVYIHSE